MIFLAGGGYEPRHMFAIPDALRLSVICKKLADFSGLYPRRSYSFVVEGSACPAADCTSSKLAPLSSAVVINVARIECAEYPLLSPIRCAYLRSMMKVSYL
jgi:hypothetical protein